MFDRHTSFGGNSSGVLSIYPVIRGGNRVLWRDPSKFDDGVLHAHEIQVGIIGVIKE